MKKRGMRQLLPTPQTSTTSTTSWIKDDFGSSSSEIDVILLDESYEISEPVPKIPKIPKIIQSKRTENSSWPFRMNAKSSNFDILHLNSSSEGDSPSQSLKQLEWAVKRDFPYFRLVNGMINERVKNLLFDRELWRFLLNLSTIYSGPDLRGDRQKRNEIAFAAWTTLLRVYAASRIRGPEQLERLAVASVTLQAKLLEEADVDLVKLERKLTKLTDTSLSKDDIKSAERKISSLLNWKLLTPSPQVFLFSSLDVLNGNGMSLPSSLKLLVSKVLDSLIEDFFVHEYIQLLREDGLASLVVSVIETVLDDFFSAFPGTVASISKSIQKHLPVQPVSKLPKRFKEKIEEAIEKIVN